MIRIQTEALATVTEFMANQRANRFCGCLCAVLATAPIPPICTAADTDVTMADVRNAWSKRQKSVRTLTIKWDRKYSSTWQDPPRGGLRPPGAPRIGEEFSYMQKAVARLNGELLDLRIQYVDARRFGALERQRCAFDGKSSRELLISSFPRPSAQAIVSDRKHEFGPNQALFIPVAVCFRPLVRTISQFEFKDLRLESKASSETRIDGHLCRMVTRKVSEHIEFLYYVDPKFEFLIRRIESRVKGRRSIQWDLAYSRDKTHGWLPSAWTMEWWGTTGNSRSKASSRVTKLEINKPIPESEFRLDFPSGANVIDKRTRKSEPKK